MDLEEILKKERDIEKESHRYFYLIKLNVLLHFI